jgi:hypothetical protein
LHRIFLLFVLLWAGLFLGLAGRAQAQNGYVQWGLSGTTAAEGILNAALIPTATGTNPVRYSNVNGMGYDVVVVTKSLTQSGAGTMPWNGVAAWWYEANTASKQGTSIPYSTVEVHFYQTGTTIPFGISGVNFTYQNAKEGERYRNFNYWDTTGNEVAVSFTSHSIFTYASGAPTLHLSDGSIDSGIPYAPGNIEGDWIGIDLSAYVISGFTFQTGRVDSNYGSNFMTALGNLIPTSRFVIQSGSDENVTAGPIFASTGSNAQLNTGDLENALFTSDAFVSTGSGIVQSILVNEEIDSDAGNSLSIHANESVFTGTSSIVLSSTSTDPGSISLVSDNSSVNTGHLEADALAPLSTSGNITINASYNITVTGDLDTSALYTNSQGGNINLTAGNSISVDTITVGNGDTPNSGAPGNISISASNSIDIGGIYNNSGYIYSPITVLSATSISLGLEAPNPPNISGTLYLQHPAGSPGALIVLGGSITGYASVVIDSGSGSALLVSEADYTGDTDILSGSFFAEGNPLAQSNVNVENAAVFFPSLQSDLDDVDVSNFEVDYSAILVANLGPDISDNVDASGFVDLDGILQVTLTPGYVPPIGASFDVIDYGSLGNHFADYRGLRLADRVLTPEYSGSSLLLVSGTIPSGTYNPIQTVPPTGSFVSAGNDYAGLTTSLETSDGFIGSGTIIDGRASQDTTIHMSLAASGTSDFALQGSVGAFLLNVLGTGSDKYVVQLDYKEAAVLGLAGDERQVYLASSDGVSPFANAVLANTNLPGESNNPTEIFGPYDPNHDFQLGYYGVDTVNDRVWAVVDYPAYFGLGALDVANSPAGPAAATLPATNILVASATLNGLVNYYGYPTAVMFETGTDPGLAGATLSGTVATGAGSGLTAISYSTGPLMPGTTYYFRIDTIGNTGTQYGGILPFQTPLGAINYWRNTYFGTYYNSGEAADNADPTDDGIPNLLKYATGLSPATASATQPVASGTTTVGGESYLTLTFNEIADPILIYSVQAASSTAGPWTTIWASTGVSNAAGPITVQDTSPIGANPSRFLRLQITY